MPNSYADLDINSCGAAILCECEECGTKFFDDEGHTAAQCAEAQHGAGEGAPPYDAATATGMYDHWR